MSYKLGKVAIIGKANVGKSSFLNAMLKQKISIVSPKPQTTRNDILGVLSDKEYQIVFIDTPGMHISTNKLGEYMNRSINQAIDDVDIILIMLDGTKKIGEEDLKLIERFKDSKQKVIVLISKTDLSSYERIYPELTKLQPYDYLCDVIPFSSHTGENLDVILESIIKVLPEGKKEDALFSDDEVTDKSVKFMASEIIREKMLWLLQEEVPHGVVVDIPTWEEEDNFINIYANIICEKENHKKIIIGSKGSMIKEIGTRARIDIEKLVNKHINLNLNVKVKEDWKNNIGFISEVGYNLSDFKNNK
jgi:GTPase